MCYEDEIVGIRYGRTSGAAPLFPGRRAGDRDVQGPAGPARRIDGCRGDGSRVRFRSRGRAAPTEIPGYRIRIFFDNGQNARSEALATQERFRSEFPGIPTFLVYENPSYIVTVGNCITIDEALMLWDRVRKSFSTAFLWRGSIPVEELLREEPVPVPESGLQADTVAAVTRVLPY